MGKKVADDIATGIHGEKANAKPPRPSLAAQQSKRGKERANTERNQEQA